MMLSKRCCALAGRWARSTGIFAGVFAVHAAPRIAVGQPIPAPVGAVAPLRPLDDSVAIAIAPPLTAWELLDERRRTPRVLFPPPAPAAPTATGRQWWAIAASAAIPGAGQALLRQPRGVAYAAVEVYMWVQRLESRRFSNRQRDRYRQIARDFARADGSGPRSDGDWDYYERLEKLCTSTLPFGMRCPSSGRYDAVPGGDVDPETDMATYNGQTWALARETYWVNPDVMPPRESREYANALAYYQRRAERPEFAWSWVNQQGPLTEYRNTIGSANAAWREAVRYKSVIVANHLLSTVDAFVTVRVGQYSVPGQPGERRSGFEASIPWAPFGRPGNPR